MNKRELAFSVTLKDCEVTTFTVGGNGGSGKDTSNTGVRIYHPPSGAVGKATDARSQLQNKRLAMGRLAKTSEFRDWARRKALNLKSVEEQVEEAMRPENLLIETYEPQK